MGAKQSYAQSRVLEALERSGGLLGQAAADLGCSRRTVSRYLERFPKLRKARLEIEERNLDRAEAKLHEAIERGDGPMIRFYLQTKGKGRGYTRGVDLSPPAWERDEPPHLNLPEPMSPEEWDEYMQSEEGQRLRGG